MRRQAIRILGTKLTLITVFTAWILIPSAAISKSLICRAQGIAGYDSYARRAYDYVGTTTEDPANAVVYITTPRPGEVYLHSNFRSPGAENPTKILLKDEKYDLETIALNIIYWGDDNASVDFSYEVFPKIKFVLDRKALKEASNLDWLGLDLTDRLYVANGFDSTAKVAHFRSAKGTEFIEQLEGSIFRRPKDDISLSDLREIPFTKSDVTVLPLITNEATAAAIGKKLPPENVAILDPTVSTAELFRRHHGKTLILLGHIESGAFVTHDSRGKEIYRLVLEEAKREAEMNQVTLVTLGCNSAAYADLGVAKEFNTLDAVDRLSNAVDASDFHDFFYRLSSDELPFVIDEQAIHAKTTPEAAEQSILQEIAATVYNQKFASEVGKVAILSVRLAPNPSIPNTSDQNSTSGIIPVEPVPPEGLDEPGRDDEGFPWSAFFPVLAVVGGGGFWFFYRRRRTA